MKRSNGGLDEVLLPPDVGRRDDASRRELTGVGRAQIGT